MATWLARQSAVAVILAKSPNDTVAGVIAGRASTPHAAQLLVCSSEMVTEAKDIGAIAAVASLIREVTRQD